MVTYSCVVVDEVPDRAETTLSTDEMWHINLNTVKCCREYLPVLYLTTRPTLIAERTE